MLSCRKWSFIRLFNFLYPLSAVIGGVVGGKEFCYSVKDNSLRFNILGDFGGLPVYPYYTPVQLDLAKQLGVFGDAKNTHFNVELGDNFYLRGPFTADDSRFKTTFEDVYTGYDSLYRPWYMIAGNHDHYGNVTAQVEYSNKSERWFFPSLYYKISYELQSSSNNHLSTSNTLIDLVFIDTQVLCGNNKHIQFGGSIFDFILTKTIEPSLLPEEVEASEKHWKWLETQLHESTADYILVFGHFPIWSIALSGPTKCLEERLRPMLHRYEAAAYFAGHDHNLQHLVDVNDTSTVHYVVSGAASRTMTSRDHEADVPKGTLKKVWPEYEHWWQVLGNLGLTSGAGFVYAEVNSSRAEFGFYTEKLNRFYAFQVKSRKQKSN